MASSSSEEQQTVVEDDNSSGFNMPAFFGAVQTLMGGDAHQDCREQLKRVQEKVHDKDVMMAALRLQHDKKVQSLARKYWIDSDDRVKRAVASREEELKEELAKDHKRELDGLRFRVRQDLEKELTEAIQAKCDKKLNQHLRDADKDIEKKIEERLRNVKREHEQDMNKRLQAMKKESVKQELAHAASYNALEEKLQKAMQLPAPPVDSATHSMDLQSDNDTGTIPQLRKENAALTRDIKMMQAAKFKEVEVAEWILDEEWAKSELDGIFNDIKQWAERHATFPIKQVLENLNGISQKLLLEGCISSEEDLRNALMRSSKVQKAGKAATMLLIALVSTLLSKSIIGLPFFAFTASDNSHQLQKRHGIVLQQVLDKIMQYDDVKAHALRCQVLRLLDPAKPAPGTFAADMKGNARASRLSFAKQWASSLVDEVSNKLHLAPRVNLEDVKSELEDIATKAAELSGRLWTQKQRWAIWKLQDLKPVGKEYQDLTYNSRSATMTHHAFHNAELSEDEDALNGKAAVLLYNPAVLAWGSEDGGDYKTNKIWRKAHVWLGACGDAAKGMTKS